MNWEYFYKFVRTKTINIRVLFISGFVILMLGALGLFFWIQSLERQIRESIQNKSFLSPKEYFTSPEYFYKGQEFSLKKWVEILKVRNYREKEDVEKLNPGSYTILQSEECFKLLADHASEIDRETQNKLVVNCIILRNPSTLDPELKDSPPQWISFDENGKIFSIYKGNPLEPAEFAMLEPLIFAQYLENEPIMQVHTPLGEIPPSCLNAVLSIEDVHFLEHHGVSASGLIRALAVNVLHRRTTQGGSTITQQMVKNYFLTPERTFQRKFLEFFMSLIIESILSKDEILETYLNILYMGQNGAYQIRGFGAASQFYFSKPIQDLTLNECSLLASVLNSPGLYNPFKNPERAKERRNLVLNKMVEYGFITEEEKVISVSSSLGVLKKDVISETAPYYIQAVNQQLKSLGVFDSAKKIYTGLNIQFQLIAQKALMNQISELEKSNMIIKKLSEKNLSLEGVSITAQPRVGIITSLIGGRNFKKTQFNRAIESRRQVGSIMKPLVFLNALIQKDDLQPLSLIKDEEFSIKIGNQKWSPENYEKSFEGEIPLYYALKNSVNSATAALGIEVGLDSLVELSKNLGVESKLEPYPSLTLGAFEMSPIEVINVYSVLSQLGIKNHLPLTFVRSALDKSNEVIYTYVLKRKQVFPSEKLSLLIGMMEETMKSGTAKLVWNSGFRIPSAGKTGTTSDYKDSWFVGFTPYQVGLVWLGYDDNTTHRLTGASGALPVWLQIMRQSQNYFPDLDFPWPSSVEKKVITDPLTLMGHESMNREDKGISSSSDSPKVELIFMKN